MSGSTELLESLEGNYTHAVIAFIGEDGYPLSVATAFEPVPDRGVVLLDPVAGEVVVPPEDREVNVVFSHIRPQPGVGYDERRETWRRGAVVDGSSRRYLGGPSRRDREDVPNPDRRPSPHRPPIRQPTFHPSGRRPGIAIG